VQAGFRAYQGLDLIRGETGGGAQVEHYWHKELGATR